MSLHKIAEGSDPRFDAALDRVRHATMAAVRDPHNLAAFDDAIDAIHNRDDLAAELSDLTPAEIGQLMGGN